MSPTGTESPLYRMWKERLDAELAQQAAWAARMAERERNRAGWHEAWHSYRARLNEFPIAAAAAPVVERYRLDPLAAPLTRPRQAELIIVPAPRSCPLHCDRVNSS